MNYQFCHHTPAYLHIAHNGHLHLANTNLAISQRPYIILLHVVYLALFVDITLIYTNNVKRITSLYLHTSTPKFSFRYFLHSSTSTSTLTSASESSLSSSSAQNLQSILSSGTEDSSS